MGWSCSAKASHRLRAIHDWIYKNGGAGITNVWVDPKTKSRYVFEIGREQSDGAITATVYRFINDTRVIRSGSIRIERDGKTMRGPAILKAIRAYEVLIDGRTHGEWNVSIDGEPTEENVREYAIDYGKSLNPGGRNAHISNLMGRIPYPSEVKVVCINDGTTVVWKAPLFMVWSA